MNRNKRIIDCTPGEIFNLGKQLIDYYLEKKEQLEEAPIPPQVNELGYIYTGEENICQDQKEL